MIDFMAGTLTLASIWIIGNKNKNGFLIALGSNALWITYALVNNHTYGVIYECVPLLFINLRNYLKWSKNI